jgi:UDP-glucuronate 4-epimerase
LLKILVTGAAGFIGSTTAMQLLKRGDTVVGLDNFNDYYDVSLKEARASRLAPYKNFSMVRIDVADRPAIGAIHGKEAQPGRWQPI